MKNIPIFALVILIATLTFAILPTDAEAEIYEDTVRLHILANSDSEKDQAVKLLLRDEILSAFGERLGEVSDTDAAKEKITELLPVIEKHSESFLSSIGEPATVSASLSTEWYDTREYEGFTLPSGYYSSLRVIIGEGKGHNWWCVMYPPLCTDIATERAPADDALLGYSNEEIRLIAGGKYNIKFKILEVAASAFRKK